MYDGPIVMENKLPTTKPDAALPRSGGRHDLRHEIAGPQEFRIS